MRRARVSQCVEMSPRTRGAFNKKNEYCSLEYISPSLATLYRLLLFLPKRASPFVTGFSPSFVLLRFSIRYVSWAGYQETPCCAVTREGVFSHKQGGGGLKRNMDNDKRWTAYGCLNVFL